MSATLSWKFIPVRLNSRPTNEGILSGSFLGICNAITSYFVRENLKKSCLFINKKDGITSYCWSHGHNYDYNKYRDKVLDILSVTKPLPNTSQIIESMCEC